MLYDYNAMHQATHYLQRLGYDTFTVEVEDVLKDHKQQQKVPILVLRLNMRLLYTVHIRTERKRQIRSKILALHRKNFKQNKRSSSH
jgi:hypothetical protein